MNSYGDGPWYVWNESAQKLEETEHYVHTTNNYAYRQESAKVTGGRGIAAGEIERVAEIADSLFDAMLGRNWDASAAVDITIAAIPAIIQAVLSR